MNDLETRAAEFVRGVWHDYLEARDYSGIIRSFDEEVTWIGTGEGELCLSLGDAVRMLGAESQEWSGHFSIVGEDYRARQLSDDLFLTFGTIRAREESGGQDRVVADINTRFSGVCRLRDGNFSVLHLHHSAPDRYQREGEFFAKSLTEQSNALLKKKIAEKTAELERLNDERRADETRYRFALEATSDLVFEYNASNGLVTANSALYLGGKDPAGFLPDDDFPHVYPEDRDRLRESLSSERVRQAFDDGETALSAEYRTLDGEGHYTWVRITLVPIRGSDGKYRRLIGSIKDIDRDKRREQEFKDQSRRDPLTGLYNRRYTEVMVNRFLEKSGPAASGALFIIDIDDFKAVNDHLGHLLGDAVLRDVSERITQLFRSTDIVGRIGGDEFVVFLKGADDEEVIGEKAGAVLNAFRSTLAGHNAGHAISGSIGIALCPRDGGDYRALFEKADSALYSAKKLGKDRCQFYDGGGDPFLPPGTRRGEEPDVGRKSFTEHIAEYIFQILYDSDDINKAVNAILAIVGRHFDVSRAYIFENTEDGLACNNTFEWCNEGVSPQIDNLQRVPYSLIGDYAANFNEDGVFYCDDISRLTVKGLHDALAVQNIHSMLQCALKNDGVFSGYVGFDECSAQRFWTQEEIDTLTFISKILSTFLIKWRTQEKLAESFRVTRAVLDHQNLWTYVIGGDHRLLYINRKTLELVPGAKVGACCYEAFWGNRAPCPQCPMREMDRTGAGSCTMELHNTQLSVWTSATASRMTWVDGQSVCLMSCVDITAYKEPDRS